MRKIVSILIILALPACWQGCESVLDKIPDGQITIDKVLDNYGDSYGLIDVVYREVYITRDRQIFHFVTFDALTDNAYKNDGNFNSYAWHNGALSLSNPVIRMDDTGAEQLWPDFWRGIRLANLAIEYLPQSTAITAQERDRWVAEARVLRCWFYMNLLEFYGPVPWIDFPFEPDYAGWNDLVRPTYDEIATQISNELMDVIALGVFPNRQPNPEFKRASNGLAYAIRARVLLNNASPLNNPENDLTKWQRAANAAQDVIDLPEYSLVNMADYKTLFVSPLPAQEVIWWGWEGNTHINFVNGVNVGVYPFATGITTVNSCGESPSQELVDCFEMKNGALPVTYNDASHLSVTVTPGAVTAGYSEADGGNPYANRDARFYVDILYNGANYGEPYNCTGDYIIETFEGGRNGFNDNLTQESQRSNTGYYNRKDTQIKHWGPGSGAYGSGGEEPNYWVLFRLAEFYLNKAEALCETGDLSNARIALNVVRERAGQPKIENVPGYNASQDFLRQRIRNERRVEFCLEGWRFHDQRRWKILSETNRFITGMRITRTGTPGAYHYERRKLRDYQSYTDKYLVMPIPLNDAKKMTGMTQPEAWR